MHKAQLAAALATDNKKDIKGIMEKLLPKLSPKEADEVFSSKARTLQFL